MTVLHGCHINSESVAYIMYKGTAILRWSSCLLLDSLPMCFIEGNLIKDISRMGHVAHMSF